MPRVHIYMDLFFYEDPINSAKCGTGMVYQTFITKFGMFSKQLN